MVEHNKIFSALKKCNQIGKKMSLSSKYILVSGLMISYDTNIAMDETKANGLSISFIDNKILKDMDAIPYIGIKIDGNELYQMSNSGKFINFTIDDNYLYINFLVTEAIDTDSFKEIFINKAIESFNMDEINKVLELGYCNNIDLYDLYLKYCKEYKNKTITSTKAFKCKIINENNKILKKSNELINILNNSKYIGSKSLENTFNAIFETTRPMNISIDTYQTRLMKSLFNTSSTKSKCNIFAYENNDLYYLITHVNNSGFDTFNIYKSVSL